MIRANLNTKQRPGLGFVGALGASNFLLHCNMLVFVRALSARNAVVRPN